MNNTDITQEETNILSFNGVYDLSYLIDQQTVVFYDFTNELYHYMPFELFNTFVRAYYHDKIVAENLIHAVLNFREVRIIPMQQVAGVKPLDEPDFHKLTLDIMNKTVGVEFESESDRREFFLENFGITLL